jgi:hypothetical protein
VGDKLRTKKLVVISGLGACASRINGQKNAASELKFYGLLEGIKVLGLIFNGRDDLEMQREQTNTKNLPQRLTRTRPSVHSLKAGTTISNNLRRLNSAALKGQFAGITSLCRRQIWC